jgi:hypothetical protein
LKQQWKSNPQNGGHLENSQFPKFTPKLIVPNQLMFFLHSSIGLSINGSKV